MLKIATWLVLVLACSKNEATMADRVEAAARLDTLATSTVRDHLQQEMKKLQEQVQKVSVIPELVEAFGAQGPERANKARLGFMKFLMSAKGLIDRPDIALVDLNGDMIAMHEVADLMPKLWRSDQPGKKTIFPALDLALSTTTSISDVAIHNDTPLRIGAATVLDGDRAIGAVILLYTIHGKAVKYESNQLGVELGYAAGTKVFMTSLGTGGAPQISEWIATSPSRTSVFAAGNERGAATYVFRTVEIPRLSATKLPADYPPSPVSVVLLGKVADIEQ